jgi:hypothetical protein
MFREGGQCRGTEVANYIEPSVGEKAYVEQSWLAAKTA